MIDKTIFTEEPTQENDPDFPIPIPPDFATYMQVPFNFDLQCLNMLPKTEDFETFLMPNADYESIDQAMMCMMQQSFLNQPLYDFSKIMPQIDRSQYQFPTDQLRSITPKPFLTLPDNRPVGPLTREERRQKLERFREKRLRRRFGKRISYTCRKLVADKRIRVKGRFISKKDAEKVSNQDQILLEGQ